jgi:hypothetical protein
LEGNNELSKAKKTHGDLNPTSGNLRKTMAIKEWQLVLPVIIMENTVHFNSHSLFLKFQVIPEFRGEKSGWYDY